MSNLYNKDKSRWSNHRRAILKRLRQNDPILTHLNLGGNRITKEGATALAEALKTNTVLTTLYLTENEITNEGATALAEALKTNTVLTTLNLSNNEITNEGATALAEALKTNTVLTTLDVAGNQISYEVDNEIKKEMARLSQRIKDRKEEEELKQRDAQLRRQWEKEQEEMDDSSSGIADFTIPITISASESNAVQRQIQNLVTTGFDEFYPKVIISYATGRRPTGDVEGAGPGLYVAAEVIKALFKNGIPCFSGLMTPAGMDWKEYFLRLDHPNAKVLVVLLSKAFFRSIPCLMEVHTGIKKGLVIIPVRVEESESGASDIARDMENMWPDATIEEYARAEWKSEVLYKTNLKKTQTQRLDVKKALRELNTFPPRGSLFGYSTGLQNLVKQVKGILSTCTEQHPPS